MWRRKKLHAGGSVSRPDLVVGVSGIRLSTRPRTWGGLHSSAFPCRRPHPEVCCEVVAARCEALTQSNTNGAVAWG
ncbi:hypothetical protein ACKVWC_007379 [Pyricularia oryzae]